MDGARRAIGRQDSWLVDKLVVRNLHTGVETVFPCGEWISKQDKVRWCGEWY